jgi:hypothetical protein
MQALSAREDALRLFASLLALFYPRTLQPARHLGDRMRLGVAPVITPSAG